ncbi:MAG TPA: class I SAM-dependent methyltransferase [Dehalococcoidia bacterium]|nr:class I SAM-dependent methyltransferase [Dehalococcoidia bacterium]
MSRLAPRPSALVRTRSRLKALLWQLLPEPALIWTMRLRARLSPANRTPEEVFTEIYEEGDWGGSGFFSGSGSHNAEIVAPYVRAVTEWLQANGGERMTLVDLGCGDFAVGSQIAPHVGRYVGVDVVAPLVEANNRRFGSDRVSFERRDIVSDDLPEGDVCTIRQVFQHLSNAQIAEVLRKTAGYRWLIVTDHESGRMKAPNLDKPIGSSTRLYLRSGVVLTEPPFNLPRDRVRRLLDLPVREKVGPLTRTRGRLVTVLVANEVETTDRSGSLGLPEADAKPQPR